MGEENADRPAHFTERSDGRSMRYIDQFLLHKAVRIVEEWEMNPESATDLVVALFKIFNDGASKEASDMPLTISSLPGEEK